MELPMEQCKTQKKSETVKCDKQKKVRREEPEKEPTKPKIDTEEDILEKVVRGLEYKYLPHQFYKQPFTSKL